MRKELHLIVTVDDESHDALVAEDALFDAAAAFRLALTENDVYATLVVVDADGVACNVP